MITNLDLGFSLPSYETTPGTGAVSLPLTQAPLSVSLPLSNDLY